MHLEQVSQKEELPTLQELLTYMSTLGCSLHVNERYVDVEVRFNGHEVGVIETKPDEPADLVCFSEESFKLARLLTEETRSLRNRPWTLHVWAWYGTNPADAQEFANQIDIPN